MKHAKLGASSSSRWLNCPASVAMCEGLKESSSDFAAEGTSAHAVAEHCLETGVRAETLIGEEFEGLVLDSTMAGYVQRYCDYVYDLMSDTSELLVEQRVSYTDWVPEGFGTADAIVIDGDNVHCVDLKYGKGIEVSAVQNTQAMLYALGVLQSYDHIYDFQTLTVHIVQPRIGNYSEWRIGRSELLEFGEYARERANLCLASDAPFGPSEVACRWCKVQATCKALADHNLAVIGADFDDLDAVELESPSVLSPSQIAKLLPVAGMVTSWLKAVETHALEQCLEGDGIPGYKAVHGRSIRRWGADDPVICEQLLELGLSDDQLHTRKLITPAQAEKLTGKGKLDDIIVKPEGKPVLAPGTDKRPAVEKTLDDFDDLD